MGVQILQGDCRDVLKTLADESVNMCVTSPPYYGLRDYKTATWSGGDSNCDHVEKIAAHGGERADRDQGGNVFKFRGTCEKCGATSSDNQIGLEQTPEEYIQQLVEVFREVRRVLKDDGTLWVNIGDSYYNYRSGTAFVKQSVAKTDQDLPSFSPSRNNKLDGLKSKDLIGIPWMLAFALRADGWYLRQDIIWHKPNPMPESVKDRCTKAHEYIFLLSKSKNYYFDHEAIKEEGVIPAGTKAAKGSAERQAEFGVNGRPPEYKIYDGMRQKRSVWTVTTKPYKGAHFATFPTDLIEPCILAGCPKDGMVLDPFGGSGTTGLVSNRLGRNATLIELNPEYIDLAEDRIDPPEQRLDSNLFTFE
jgi:DNA modification methylase